MQLSLANVQILFEKQKKATDYLEDYKKIYTLEENLLSGGCIEGLRLGGASMLYGRNLYQAQDCGRYRDCRLRKRDNEQN